MPQIATVVKTNEDQFIVCSEGNGAGGKNACCDLAISKANPKVDVGVFKTERMSDKKLTITNTTARKARENRLIGNPHFPKLKREGSRGLLEILLHTKHPMQME